MRERLEFAVIEKFLRNRAIEYSKEESLAYYTTIRIGGRASIIAFPSHEEEVVELILQAEALSVPWYVVGGGSNLLCADEGFQGLVLSFKELRGIKVLEESELLRIEVLSGTKIAELLSFLRRKGYTGLEFLAGVPATVGGAIRMNAGAYGRTFSLLVKRIRMLQGQEVVDYAPADTDWTYRSFIKRGIILAAELVFTKENPEEVTNKIKELYLRRKSAQPLTAKSFGSAFKNPPCCYAGKLIEECGLKGYKVGGAKISEKHANFIVNEGKATAKDVLVLMKRAQEEVYKRFSIFLEPEVKFLGCSL